MKTLMAAVALVLTGVVTIRADVTLVQTMRVEGAAAAVMGGGQVPRITMRIKGRKSRADIEVNGQTVSSITDLSSKAVILLNPAAKTATIVTPEAAPPASQTARVDGGVKPTGKSQVIDGQHCDEHSLALRFNMADVAGAQLPPEALAMMKGVDVVMNGSIWIAASAPGAAEYAAFNKAAVESHLINAVTGMMAGGAPSGGLDKLFEAAALAPGLPYVTDITMTMEGAGPMVEAMKRMGPVRMIQKITSVSTDPVSDSAFEIPSDYKIEKR